jgi:hypothetical protein
MYSSTSQLSILVHAKKTKGAKELPLLGLSLKVNLLNLSYFFLSLFLSFFLLVSSFIAYFTFFLSFFIPFFSSFFPFFFYSFCCRSFFSLLTFFFFFLFFFLTFILHNVLSYFLSLALPMFVFLLSLPRLSLVIQQIDSPNIYVTSSWVRLNHSCHILASWNVKKVSSL